MDHKGQFTLIFLILRWVLLYGKLGATIVEDLAPRIPVWPTLVVTAVLSVYGYGHHVCEVSHKQEQVKLEQKNDKVEQTVKQLTPGQLDKRIKKYFRD